MPYSKALGTYRRINNIKRATDNIMEAEHLMSKQRIDSANEARKAERRMDLTSAVANIVSGATGYGMGKSTRIDPDMARKISAGIGAAGSAAVGIAGTGVDTTGFTYGDHAAFRDRNRSNIAEGAIAGYTLQDMIEGINKSKAFEDQQSMLEENEHGLSVDQMRPYVDEVDWTKNVGYDFSTLPDITQQRINEARKAMNFVPGQQEKEEQDLSRFNNILEALDNTNNTMNRGLQWL